MNNNQVAIATKEQERNTLKKIKKMVEALGPQSYLATAFDGCFEDAETNIENDFAFSMKDRFESSEEKLREMGSKLVSAKSDASHAQEQLAAAEARIEELSRTIEALEIEVAQRTFPEWLSFDLHVLLNEEDSIAKKRMAESADRMATHADNAGCVAFTEAVEEYRTAKERQGRCKRLLDGLDAINPKQ